ncbi:ABC transporter substrate-binding protein [Agrobacterium vitis]|nr:ABC transporter substrate-binding protein [Agrobacterium vitis]
MNVSRRFFNASLIAASLYPFTAPNLLAAGEAPVKGGSLKIAWGSEPTEFVPVTTSAGSTQFVGAKLFDGLLTYDIEQKPQPQLAERWEASPDGLSYTFVLREGIKFTDGKPLTSADVAYSINKLKTVHPRGKSTFASVSAIETPDARTAILRLSTPAPYLIAALSAAESPIIPKHVYEPLKDGERIATNAIVGSGPFRVAEWQKGSHIIFNRNPDYWDKNAPLVDRIIVRFISDPSARAAALEAGDIDVVPEDLIPLSDIARFDKLPDYVVDRGPYAYYGSIQQGLSFNFDNEILKKVKVRQAIAHSLNVNEIIEKIYFGNAVPSPTAITVYNKAYHDASQKGYAYDPAKANQLLDEAGHPRGADGFRFTLRLTWNTEGALPATIATLYRQSLSAVGINAVIQTSDFAAFTKQIYTDRAWDLAIDRYGSTFDPTVGTQRFYHSKSFKIGVPFTNPARYLNPEADALWDAAAVEVDETKRRKIFAELQAILLRDLPILPQVVASRNIVTRRTVHDYATHATGSFDSAAQAWIKP